MAFYLYNYFHICTPLPPSLLPTPSPPHHHHNHQHHHHIINMYIHYHHKNRKGSEVPLPMALTVVRDKNCQQGLKLDSYDCTHVSVRNLYYFFSLTDLQIRIVSFQNINKIKFMKLGIINAVGKIPSLHSTTLKKLVYLVPHNDPEEDSL